MYSRFGLTLMLNHACNLRCSYCYTGLKFSRHMPQNVAEAAISRAIASLQPGGTLELSFFGGEPLLEADLIRELAAFARERCESASLQLAMNLTTNGTINSDFAWEILNDPEIDIAISFDGLPEVHDKHRMHENGDGSSVQVLATMRRLFDAGKDFSVVSVVRPDTVSALPSGLRFLKRLGVRMVEPSLDLWAKWSDDDCSRLEAALYESAAVWWQGLPYFGVSWFNEKAVELTNVPVSETARCGFGDGEIAVAPSGNLYPCERLIGEDKPENSMRLPGNVFEGARFSKPQQCCELKSSCGLSCGCSNYVRSGNINQSDTLLERLDQVCMRATRRALLGGASQRVSIQTEAI